MLIGIAEEIGLVFLLLSLSCDFPELIERYLSDHRYRTSQICTISSCQRCSISCSFRNSYKLHRIRTFNEHQYFTIEGHTKWIWYRYIATKYDFWKSLRRKSSFSRCAKIIDRSSWSRCFNYWRSCSTSMRVE